MSARLEIFAIPGIPMVAAGDDLPSLIADAVKAADMTLRDRDVVVLAQKLASSGELLNHCVVIGARYCRHANHDQNT